MKNLQKLSLITLSIALLGCGGGGDSLDSSSDNNTSVNKDGILNGSFDNYTTFKWGSIQFQDTFVEITKFQRNSNIEYADNLKADRNTKLFDDSVQIGSDGVYIKDKNKYPLGFRKSFVNFVSEDGNIINRSVYNVHNLKKVREEEKGKWVDLTGKKLSSHTAITWNAMLTSFPEHSMFNPGEMGEKFKDFLKQTRITQFPKGSKCFISESKTYSEPFYIMTDLNTSAYINGQRVTSFSEYVDLLGSDRVKGNWGGTEWAYSKEKAVDPRYFSIEVAANINNQLAMGYWTKNTKKTSQALIQEYKDLLNSSYVSPEDDIYWNAWINAIENECTYYNPVAATTVQNLVNNTLK